MTGTAHLPIGLVLAVVASLLPFAAGAARAETATPYQYGDWLVECYSGLMPSVLGPTCFISTRIGIDKPDGGRESALVDIRAPQRWDAEVMTSGENAATCGQLQFIERLPSGYTPRDRVATAAERARLNAQIAAIIRSHLAVMGDCKAAKAQRAALVAAFDTKLAQLQQAIAHVENHWAGSHP